MTAVATCGTALGEDHFDLLRRFSDRVVLAFDSDQAGAGAALRGDQLRTPVDLDFDLRVAEIPDGMDPADLVQAGRGAELARQSPNRGRCFNFESRRKSIADRAGAGGKGPSDSQHRPSPCPGAATPSPGGVRPVRRGTDRRGSERGWCRVGRRASTKSPGSIGGFGERRRRHPKRADSGDACQSHRDCRSRRSIRPGWLRSWWSWSMRSRSGVSSGRPGIALEIVDLTDAEICSVSPLTPAAASPRRVWSRSRGKGNRATDRRTRKGYGDRSTPPADPFRHAPPGDSFGAGTAD